MTELSTMYAHELRAAYLARAVSPVEATQATLDRIARVDPTLGAFVTVTADVALQYARESERRYRVGRSLGPLDGVPVSIKDVAATAGIRTTWGSLLFQDHMPDNDAEIVSLVYASGAVLLGKTNCPEFGWKGETTNRVFGSTRNPHDLNRTAGGSSGGAAAAVSAGLGPVALGSDGAGSIRIPASFCGVVGFKPTRDLLPHWPTVAGLGQVGPLARTVVDIEAFVDAMLDDASWRAHRDGIDPDGARPLRIAWAGGHASLDPEVEGLTRDATAVLADGREYDEHELPGDPFDTLEVIWQAMAAGRLPAGADVELLDPGYARVVAAGQQITGAQLVRALLSQVEYVDRVDQLMQRYDLLVMPTTPIQAFELGRDAPDAGSQASVVPLDWTPFTYPFNLTGQPAISVPCGWTSDGLPVGVQIVAAAGADGLVMRAARILEEHFGPARLTFADVSTRSDGDER